MPGTLAIALRSMACPTRNGARPKADQHRRARYRGKHGEFGMSASAMRSALIGEHWRYE